MGGTGSVLAAACVAILMVFVWTMGEAGGNGGGQRRSMVKRYACPFLGCLGHPLP